MSKKKRDNLESFFRKGLGAHDFEFRDHDWVELEAKLDEADRSRALFWRNFFAASTAILIGLILLLLNLPGDAVLEDVALPSISNEPGLEGEKTHPDESLEPVESSTPKEDFQLDYLEGTVASQPSSPNIEEGAPNTFRQSSSDPGQPIIDYSSPEAVSPSQGSLIEQVHVSEILSSATAASIHSKSAGNLTEPNLATVSIDGFEAPVPDIVDESGLEPDRDSRFAVGLLIGPDWSSVGTSDYTSPGFNLGLNLEFYLLSKFTITGGVILGTKKYLAKGREYGKGRGLWTRGVVPDTTMGKCLVLDIPINLRYYPVAGTRHKFFLSSGISSYIFLTEDYQFLYAMNASDLIQSWSGKNEVRNYFAVVNFSLGYELHLQREFYLQIEPFFKVPLEELGFGNVDLLTTGMYFTIKYRFHRRRKTLNLTSSQ